MTKTMIFGNYKCSKTLLKNKPKTLPASWSQCVVVYARVTAARLLIITPNLHSGSSKGSFERKRCVHLSQRTPIKHSKAMGIGV